MIYSNVEEGIFISRLNRFIAEVKINGNIEKVHVKNTGRCKELFIYGSKVYLEKASNIDRKTKYSLISIYKKEKLINVDSQVPNLVIYESMKSNTMEEFDDITEVAREKTFGNSRFDIYYKRKNGKEGFVEIKGVTLENEGKSKFPDAPTKRGEKHVREMIEAVKIGYEGNILFLIQMSDVTEFRPNKEMDNNFAKALCDAKSNNVNIIVYTSSVTKNSINLFKKVNKVII